MKAAVFNRKNKTRKFEIKTIEKPEPKAGEVLFKIKAVAINAADYRSVQMHIVPKHGIMGADVSGVVEKVGEGVTQFKIGDEVVGDIANYGFGGFAEYAVATESYLVRKPNSLDFEEAAALPMACVTALQALSKGKIQSGMKVLIAGSGGGVGTSALQLAKYFKTEVHAVCGPNNLAQSFNLGASKVIDYTKEDFAQSGEKYDLIIAANGNRSLLAYKRALKPNGIYVMLGGALSQVFRSLILGRFLSFGSQKMLSLAAKPNQEQLNQIMQLASEGHIKPVIDKIYTLDETDEAMRYVSGGHAKGKVVIKVE